MRHQLERDRFLRQFRLFAVETESSLKPARSRLAAPVQGALKSAGPAIWGDKGNEPAVAKWKSVGGDETQATGMDVAGEDLARPLLRRVAEQPEAPADPVADA